MEVFFHFFPRCVGQHWAHVERPCVGCCGSTLGRLTVLVLLGGLRWAIEKQLTLSAAYSVPGCCTKYILPLSFSHANKETEAQRGKELFPVIHSKCWNQDQNLESLSLENTLDTLHATASQGGAPSGPRVALQCSAA